MKNIGIVGSGIAGLHLGLFLQRHGVDATIYSDRSPDQIRAQRYNSSGQKIGAELEVARSSYRARQPTVATLSDGSSR